MADEPLTRRGFLRAAAGAVAASAALGSACSSGDDDSPTTAGDQPGGGERTLRIALVSHYVPAYDQWFDEQYVRRWSETNDVKVTVDHISLAELASRAAAEASGRRGHDIFAFSSPPAGFEDDVIDHREIVEELKAKLGAPTSIAERSAFNPKTGKWFGVPEYWSPNLINYRTDLWGSAGESAAPRSWEDLVRAGPRLKAAGHPLGIGLSADFDSNMTLFSLLHAYGASVQDDGGNVALDSPGAREAVKVGAAIYQTGMTDEVLSWDSASNNRFLVTGRGSLIFNPVSGLRAFEKQDPALAATVGLSPPMSGPGGRFGTHSFLGVSVIWRFAEHTGIARQFLVDQATAYDEAFRASEFYNLPAFPGAVRDLSGTLAADPAIPAGKYGLLAQATEWSTNVGHPGYANAAMDEVFNLYLIPKMFASAATGERTPEEAVMATASVLGPIFAKWRERGKI